MSSDTAKKGRILLSRCFRLRQCGFAPNCVCDVDPTDPRDVADWARRIGALLPTSQAGADQ